MLTLRTLPLPAAAEIDGVLAEQLGPRLAQLRADPVTYAPLITLAELVDTDGVVRFEACLFRGEDGPVYRLAHTIAVLAEHLRVDLIGLLADAGEAVDITVAVENRTEAEG